ncbi:MAG TPA: pyrimidine/purine nucleotide monophosphate nucleosidase domain-containing protein, partial [Rhodanobacteraceae bacterium]|nr:pyrimidine/purine nucleotide monophosphate nucleosidase domain-containing protein [Rhodanobacteraceae bacterium]
GDKVATRYRIVVGDPREVAHQVRKGIERVRTYRLDNKDAFFFNWALHIEREFQVPFMPTHEGMAALNLHRGQEPHRLAADLRRAFSGIVAGNVKEDGMRAIDEHGPFVIDGDREIMQALDELLSSFVAQQRMKLPGKDYVPCYRVRAG